MHMFSTSQPGATTNGRLTAITGALADMPPTLADAGHHADAAQLAERARQRFTSRCAAGVADYIFARRIGLWHDEASDVFTFPSPMTAGAYVEIALTVEAAGRDWRVEVAQLTPKATPALVGATPPKRQRMMRRVLATVERDADGEVYTDVHRPLPAVLLASLPSFFADITHPWPTPA